MDLVDEDTHRMLSYIGRMRAGGHKLTINEFDEFAKRPGRKQRRRFSPAQVAMRTIAGIIEGTEYIESPHDWFIRLNWAQLDNPEDSDSGIRLTSLGHTLLRDLDTPPPPMPDESSSELVLDPNDPLSYAHLIGRINSIGDNVLLVDPYFRTDQLGDILPGNVTRVLTSHKISRNEIERLRLGLRNTTEDARPEIRAQNDLHDRFAISESGRVIAIGTSLNSAGKNFSMVMPLSDVSAASIKSTHEDLWQSADKITPKTDDPSTSEPED